MPTKHANFLTLNRGKPVQVLAKSPDATVLGIEYQGQRGLATPKHIHEQRIVRKTEDLIRVPIASVPWLKLKPAAQAPIQPAQVPVERSDGDDTAQVPATPPVLAAVETAESNEETNAKETTHTVASVAEGDSTAAGTSAEQNDQNLEPVDEPLVVKKTAYQTTDTNEGETSGPHLELLGVPPVDEKSTTTTTTSSDTVAAEDGIVTQATPEGLVHQQSNESSVATADDQLATVADAKPAENIYDPSAEVSEGDTFVPVVAGQQVSSTHNAETEFDDMDSSKSTNGNIEDSAIDNTVVPPQVTAETTKVTETTNTPASNDATTDSTVAPAEQVPELEPDLTASASGNVAEVTYTDTATSPATMSATDEKSTVDELQVEIQNDILTNHLKPGAENIVEQIQAEPKNLNIDIVLDDDDEDEDENDYNDDDAEEYAESDELSKAVEADEIAVTVHEINTHNYTESQPIVPNAVKPVEEAQLELNNNTVLHEEQHHHHLANDHHHHHQPPASAHHASGHNSHQHTHVHVDDDSDHQHTHGHVHQHPAPAILPPLSQLPLLKPPQQRRPLQFGEDSRAMNSGHTVDQPPPPINNYKQSIDVSSDIIPALPAVLNPSEIADQSPTTALPLAHKISPPVNTYKQPIDLTAGLSAAPAVVELASSPSDAGVGSVQQMNGDYNSAASNPIAASDVETSDVALMSDVLATVSNWFGSTGGSDEVANRATTDGDYQQQEIPVQFGKLSCPIRR